LWAQVIPPDYDSLTSDPESLPAPVPLTDPDEDGMYQGAYSEFGSRGTYPIVIKAAASQEIFSYVSMQKETLILFSEPVYTSVTQTAGSVNPYVEPDEFESDGTIVEAKPISINDTPQHHNFHAETDEDWVMFYAIPGVTYTVKVGDLTIVCDAAVALFDANGTKLMSPQGSGGPGQDEYLEWTCPVNGEGVYYVKVANENTNYGENTRYKLSVYQPIGGVPGTLWGFVFNELAQGVGGATIKFNLSATTGTAMSMASGYYRAVLPSGTWPVDVQASGYEFPAGQTVTVMAENEVVQFLFMSSPAPPVKKGDLDGDGDVDQADADLALQVLAGQSPAGIRPNYGTSGADVNGDGRIGKEEAVYILERLGGVRP
jgi:hypothetical protein